MIQIKTFEELTNSELYEILKLRQNIFIIEQRIIYPDLDDKDFNSLHMWIEENGIQSYLRMIPLKQEKTLSIGRVLTTLQMRGKGAARRLIKAALDFAKTQYSGWSIHLHAQEYLKDFYGSLGFVETGSVFYYPDEDPVPHVPMEYQGS